ncbi:MAG: BamA/TamA family outer membrane protein [Fibrobacter sp.]|nr:BamA/TamA family outer membrane protein [Fibrobacter sp.]
MEKTNRLVAFLVLWICAGALWAEPADTSATEAGTDHFQRFSSLPILGYSEETGLEYGAMLLLFFKPDHAGGKSTTLDFAAIGTTKKQLELLLVPRYYFLHDRITGEAGFTYDNWTSYYYGTGNDPDPDDGRMFDRITFKVTNTTLTNLGLSGIWSKFMYGPAIHLEYSDITFRSYDGTLAEPATDDKLRTGFGYQLAYDTRDNKNWARHGFYAHWNHLVFSDLLGDCGFSKQELDLRGYTFLFWKTSMAVGALWQRASGDVPFDMLAGPDGIKRFRGVEDHYFRGNQALILQTELRKVLFWRLGGTIFFEGGKTGDYFSDLMREKWHQAVGFGGELGLNMKESLYARGDISWVDYKQLGLTVYIRQAF